MRRSSRTGDVVRGVIPDSVVTRERRYSRPTRSEDQMSKPFKGVVNVDVRDSVPDWDPFQPPMAPEGAPNVVYIVLDDVGFGAIGCYGGPIETPNIDRIAAEGL